MTEIQLKPIAPDDIKILYDWFRHDENLYKYTCRPVVIYDEGYKEYEARKLESYKSLPDRACVNHQPMGSHLFLLEKKDLINKKSTIGIDNIMITVMGR